MDNLALLLLLAVAVAVGFALGRVRRRREPAPVAGLVSSSFLARVAAALEGNASLDVRELLIEGPLDPGYPAVLLALGSYARGRGDVDAAMQLHQYLLARSELTSTQRRQAELALGLDYYAAGQLDRAQVLLQDVGVARGADAAVAQSHLMRIHDRRQDWTAALASGERLARSDATARQAMAQYCCEIAQQTLLLNELRQTRRTLKRALDLDPACGRAELLLADVELAAGHQRRALKHLRRARQASPWLVSSTLARVRKIGMAVGDDSLYTDYLDSCSGEAPSPGVVEEVAEEHRRRGGEEAAFDYLLSELERRPSAGGLLRALRRRSALAGGELERVRVVLELLSADALDYCCIECGLESADFRWQCDGCRSWATVRPNSGG